MNGYGRVSHVFSDIAGASGVKTDLLSTYVRTIETWSRAIDKQLNPRHFYAKTETRYYDGGGASMLTLDDDLLSVTQVLVDLNGDYTPETELTEGADFWAWPPNEERKLRLDIHPAGSLAAWPSGPRRVSVTGVWGYSNATEDTGLTGTVADATATTITLSDGGEGLIDVGETLVIEDEQVYVTAVVAATLTVQRGVNGTTAAAHSTKTVYRRRYPDDIEEAVRLQAVRLRWASQTGFTGAVMMADEQDIGGRFNTSLFPVVQDIIQNYVVTRVA